MSKKKSPLGVLSSQYDLNKEKNRPPCFSGSFFSSTIDLGTEVTDASSITIGTNNGPICSGSIDVDLGWGFTKVKYTLAPLVHKT